MSNLLRYVLASVVSFGIVGCVRSVQAQTTYEAIFYCGVVGDPSQTRLSTVEGDHLTFTTDRPTIGSLNPISDDPAYTVAVAQAPTGFAQTLYIFHDESPTEAAFEAFPLVYGVNGAVTGSGELYIIIFSTAVHRDAFLYYLQQLAVAATEAEAQYFTTLASYEFWMGQENEGLALYHYYTGLAQYYRDTAANPQQGLYYYYYYTGLGAYYYFVGIGDQASADLAFAYHYQLAVDSL